MPNLRSLIPAFCREPYRLFFPLGVLMGSVGAGHWLFYWLKWMPNYSAFFHSSLQILVYMNCFIIGFLMTAVPRFTMTRPATAGEVAGALFVLLGIAGFLSLEQWVAAEGCYILWLALLARFALVRIAQRPRHTGGQAPLELVWVPIAVLHGVVGTLVLMLGQLKVLPLWALKVGKPMMDQGFLLCIVLGVGGFLIPRIMGTYPSVPPLHNGHDEEDCHARTVPVHRPAGDIRYYLAGGLLILLSFWIEGLGWPRWGYILRAGVATAVFLRTGALKWPRFSDLYIRLTWVSVWMTLLGFWLAGIFVDYNIVMLHISFIGGFSLMTFAIATMVTMSHAGQAENLRKPLWVLWVVGLGLALAVMKRTMLIAYPDAYFRMLGLAAAFWIFAGLCWLAFALPLVLKIPNQDEFEKMHEEAKKRMGGS